MSASRRQVLRALAALPVLALRGENRSAAVWRAALDLPRSRYFGVTADGQPRDPESFYRLDTAGGAPLSFDISNNRILCCLSPDGALERVCINTGILPLAGAAITGGVYNTKVLIRGGPWRWTVRTRDTERPENIEVALLKNLIPEFRWSQGTLRLHQIAFTPVDREHPELSPRAICLAFLLENRGPGSVEGSIIAPQALHTAAGNGHAASIAFSPADFRLQPSEQKAITFAVMLEDSAEALTILERKLRARDAAEWFADTLTAQSERYGNWKIPEAPFFAENSVRFAENCRQSILRLNDGRFGAGFMGSDIDARDQNWNKDTYYCVLGASMFEPSLCAAAIPYYFRWGLPAKPIARGLSRFPDGERFTQSLSLAVAPLALATAYYKLTGDRDYFLRFPGFLDKAKALLDGVLASRRGEPLLFPSMFISNGDARGHYHTGSNVAAWYAFCGMSRLAGEVFQDAALQQEWREVASRIRQSILDICRGEGPSGRQFFEGVYEDRTYVPGHDGEESDTTLMPFYGFCAADDPELRRHAKLGFSPSNPYYAETIDGIWWYNHGGFRPATAPAWATALAGAATIEELKKRLRRFRQLSDLDGSLWWWPYLYGEKNPMAVGRGNGATKCGWASAVYLLRFIHDIIGIDVDAPAREFSFRPFFPWSGFEWTAARIGRVEFDVRYQRVADTVTATFVNRNAVAVNASVELTAAGDRTPVDCFVNGIRTTDWKSGEYYERPTARVRHVVTPGGTLEVRIRA